MFAGEFERRRAVLRQEADRAQWADLANTEFKFDVNGVGEKVVGPIYFGRAYEKPPLFSYSSVSAVGEGDIIRGCEFPSERSHPWRGYATNYTRDNPPKLERKPEQEIVWKSYMWSDYLVNPHQDDLTWGGYSHDPQFETQMQWNGDGYIPKSNEHLVMAGYMNWPEATYPGTDYLGNIFNWEPVTPYGLYPITWDAPTNQHGYEYDWWVPYDYQHVNGWYGMYNAWYGSYWFDFIGRSPGFRNFWIQTQLAGGEKPSDEWFVRERHHNSVPRKGRFAAEYTFGAEAESPALIPISVNLQPLNYGTGKWYGDNPLPERLDVYRDWNNRSGLPPEWGVTGIPCGGDEWPDSYNWPNDPGDPPVGSPYSRSMPFETPDWMHTNFVYSYNYDWPWPAMPASMASGTYTHRELGGPLYFVNPSLESWVYDYSFYASKATRVKIKTIHWYFHWNRPISRPIDGDCAGFSKRFTEPGEILMEDGMITGDGWVFPYQELYSEEQYVDLAPGWNFGTLLSYVYSDIYPNITDGYPYWNYYKNGFVGPWVYCRIEISFESPGVGETVAVGKFSFAPNFAPQPAADVSVGVADWIQDDKGAYVGAYLWVKVSDLEV